MSINKVYIFPKTSRKHCWGWGDNYVNKVLAVSQREDSSSISSIHVKSIAWWHVTVVPELGRQTQEAPEALWLIESWVPATDSVSMKMVNDACGAIVLEVVL